MVQFWSIARHDEENELIVVVEITLAPLVDDYARAGNGGSVYGVSEGAQCLIGSVSKLTFNMKVNDSKLRVVNWL